MAKIERHPAPEKLLLQVTTEAVSALALAGEDKSGDAASLEAGVDLIAKAWGLPQEPHPDQPAEGAGGESKQRVRPA